MSGVDGYKRGFTLVELLVVMVVVASLAAISTVAYRGFQKRAIEAVIISDLRQVATKLNLLRVASPSEFDSLDDIPDDITPSKDITFTYNPVAGSMYADLTPVQNGVLFYDICEELVSDRQYLVIHSKDGKSTQDVVMRCTDNINGESILITGWDSQTWNVPVSKASLENYIKNVPYDSWWIDRQDVVRGFYREMISRFESRGGKFPITSFWDPWANQWSGVQKEELPPLVSRNYDSGTFCVEAYHNKYPENKYKITENSRAESGTCS